MSEIQEEKTVTLTHHSSVFIQKILLNSYWHFSDYWAIHVGTRLAAEKTMTSKTDVILETGK